MKVILSPAKSLNEDCVSPMTSSQVAFPQESEKLSKKLSKLSKVKISKLMGISKDLSELNYNRFQNWSLPFTEENSKQAVYMFSGAAYQGLDYSTMSISHQKDGENILRILSGLYGVLKPFDLIQPYRLEMGTSLKVTTKITNLYKFWGDKIRNSIEADLAEDESPILVNLASNEYSKAVQLNKLDYRIITPVFKDINKNLEYKMNMTFAKLSRGRMTRFIIENGIQNPEEMKVFDKEGYYFSERESSENEYVFLRDKF